MIDLSIIKKVHFTGIKGVGMTALACIAKDYGLKVTGSDTDEIFVTDSILKSKAIVNISQFSADKIETIQPQLLIYTLAHGGEKNQEVIKAQSLNIPTLSFAQALAAFTQDKTTIAISGVGGKTTTTAMITTIFNNLNQNPSYLIGSGQVKSLSFPGAYHFKSPFFIAEADEYKSSVSDLNPKFHYLHPTVLVIPNLAFDHPDLYQNQDATLKVFKTYIEKLPSQGALIINLDCPMSQKLLQICRPQAQVISYAITNLKATYQLSQIETKPNQSTFVLDHHQFNLPFVGDIYLLNATAAILTAHFFNFDYQAINHSLSSFLGVKRRLETVMSHQNTLILDDYAHHPTEICSVLNILKNHHPDKQVIAIFEPHTLSRTKSLLSDFASCFDSCSQVIVADIFTSAREKDDHSISSKDLVDQINQTHHHAKFLPSYSQILTYLKTIDLNQKIIITLGAGNIYHVAHELKKYLNN